MCYHRAVVVPSHVIRYGDDVDDVTCVMVMKVMGAGACSGGAAAAHSSPRDRALIWKRIVKILTMCIQKLISHQDTELY